MGDAQGQHHLVLPQGDGVHDGGLNLLGHHRVVGLDQADLRAHLDGDVAGQLQIVELFLKAVAHIGQVAGGLGILGQLGTLGLLLGGFQLIGTHIGQLLFAGQNVHRQLFEVDEVVLVHLIEHGNVLHQDDLVIFQLRLDALDVFVGAVIAGLELLDAVGRLFEEAQNTLGLLGVGVKALQFGNQAGDKLAGLAHILGLDAGERRLGEVAQLFLAGGTVLQDHLGVSQVDFFGKIVDHLLLLRGEGGILHLHRGRLFALLDDFFISGGVKGQRRGGGGGVQGQGRGNRGVQIQFIVQVSHGRLSFLHILLFRKVLAF